MRCLIIDDETPARARMRRMLTAFDDVEIVGEAADGIDALEQIAKIKPDLILLDVDMPELDGLGVAAALGGVGPAIVFVTAYDEHALKAFELSAMDYLVKPVAQERLAAAIDKMRGRQRGPADAIAELTAQLEVSRRPNRMAVKCGAKFVIFELARVSAVLSQDHYSAIIVDGKELLADDSLDQLSRRFGEPNFLRVHRGALINLAFVRELVNEGDRRYIAVLNDAAATRVTVSRERLPLLKAALGIE